MYIYIYTCIYEYVRFVYYIMIYWKVERIFSKETY
jgi:hypothetical protein